MLGSHDSGLARRGVIIERMSDVTRILEAIDQGDPQASADLLPLVYDELRRLAAAKLAQEKPGQTLQATALVHEAYLTAGRGRPDPALEQSRPFLRRGGRGHAADPRRKCPAQESVPKQAAGIVESKCLM